MCREIVGLETPKSRVTSPTVATPPLSRSTMPRRSGCARALNASLAILLIVWTRADTDWRRPTMAEHRTASRDEWLAARRELLEAEKEHMRQGDELARRRQELPWIPIENEYVFETDSGKKTLAELFDGRSQLLVYHFMFGFGFRVDEQNPGCTGCSLIADHFDGIVPHLNGHDVTLVAESIAPLEELRPYKERMAWRFPWVSSLGSNFKYDFGVAFTDE